MTVYGKERLFTDLQQMGYNVEKVNDAKGIDYVIIRDYFITIGKFLGKVIDLAIPVPKDYPRVSGSSIHLKSNPHLLDKTDTIKGKRNIIDSPLGDDWRYWSFRFQVSPENPSQDLLSQINGIFRSI